MGRKRAIIDGVPVGITVSVAFGGVDMFEFRSNLVVSVSRAYFVQKKNIVHTSSGCVVW